jgi:hypothetical protein
MTHPEQIPPTLNEFSALAEINYVPSPLLSLCLPLSFFADVSPK